MNFAICQSEDITEELNSGRASKTASSILHLPARSSSKLPCPKRPEPGIRTREVKFSTQRHRLILLGVLFLLALSSRFQIRSIDARAEALESFLAIIPGPVLLADKTSRSLVFMNASDHPHILTEFAERNALPTDLMEQVFELPEGEPVPSGLRRAELIGEEHLFEVGQRTAMSITPIALKEDQTEALFGAVYSSSNTVEVRVVVVLVRQENGVWVVHKVARMV